MSILIVTRQSQLSQRLINILRHYFNPSSSQFILNVKTKYYTCDVPIKICSPQNLACLDQQEKIDLLLFLFDQKENIDSFGSLIDENISKISPQSQIVIVNSMEDSEQEWKYQQQILNCQNFVSVVYEDIQKVQKTLPQWKEGGLLSENEEQFQIFSLFELIQTTVWTNSLKVTAQKKHIEEKMVEAKEFEKKIEDKLVQQHSNQMKVEEKSKAEKKQQNKIDEEDFFEENEGNLEKQMMQFQLLMQQMMSMKDKGLKGNERKMKAEELIMKLAGNMNFL